MIVLDFLNLYIHNRTVPKDHSHLPKGMPSRSLRSYYGEDDGVVVVGWLNRTAGTRENRRIVGLIADLVKLCGSVRPVTLNVITPRDWESMIGDHPEAAGMRLHDVAVRGWVKSSAPLQMAGELDFQILHRVQQRLSRYTFSAVVLPLPMQSPNGLHVDWMPAIRLRWARRMTAADKSALHRAQEAQVVRHLVELVRVGLIHRIKQCPCSRWFFAKFTHAQFCSTTCQQKFYHANEEWKERRKKQRREYYRLHKLGIVKERGV